MSMTSAAVTVFRQVACAIALLATLNSHRVCGEPQSFQPQGDVGKCIGEPVTFTCTVVDDDISSGGESTVWRADGGINCIGNIAHSLGLTDLCSDGDPNTDDPFFISGTVQNTNCVVFELSADTARVDMDNTLIECHNSTAVDPGSLVGSSRLFVEDTPPSSSTDMSVIVNPQRDFVTQWSGATVGSLATISGYNVDISGPDDGCGDRSVPQFTAVEQYQCSMPSVGETYTFSVSAVCGTLKGTAVEASVTLQVPSPPGQLMVTPVYDQSTGALLRIKSQISTVPPETLATTSTGFTLDEEPARYHFTYSGGTTPVTQTVESGTCTGGQCRDVFTVSGEVPPQYVVSVVAENRIGVGTSTVLQGIITTNNFVEVSVDVSTMTVVCRFPGGFTGTAECQIEYSTREDLSGSFVDTGSSTSGDTVTVTITATLERDTTYYYLVTARGTVGVQGFFRTDCLASELGSVVDLDTDLNERCTQEGFSGSVQIPAGRACYTGTALGSSAEYFCSCPQYGLEGPRTRVCQSDGSWSGTTPQCLPQCNTVPAPTNGVSHFVAVDCSQDNSVVTATYSCGLNKDNMEIEFSTPNDGNCQWADPPCEASQAVGGIVGAVLFGFTILAILSLVLRILAKVKLDKWLIATVLVMCLILPPVGLVLTWWLTFSERAPSTKKDKTFIWKWWKVIMAVVGCILWFATLIIWIALAVIFGPPDALPSNSEYNLLITGLVLVILTLVYCVVMVTLGLGLPTHTKDRQEEDMNMKENASYGPVVSLGFKPRVPVHEETTSQEPPEDTEMSMNIAYGTVSN